MNLNEYWQKLTVAKVELERLNEMWKKEYAGNFDLVRCYDMITKEAKSTLVRLAVKQTIEKHGIYNVEVSEEVISKLIEQPTFNTDDIEAAIKEPYIGQADAEAQKQLITQARRLVPYPAFDKKATVQDIAKGRRLTLRVRWFYDNVDSQSYDELHAFQILLYSRLRNVPLSKCFFNHASIGTVIENFRDSHKPFNQARAYVYDDGIIEGFRLYKNGHIEIIFKKEADAETAAKILLAE